MVERRGEGIRGVILRSFASVSRVLAEEQASSAMSQSAVYARVSLA